MLTLNTLDPSVGDDGGMAKKPRTDRPRRRSFSPAENLRLLAGHETATESGTGMRSCGRTACTRR
jgi:transposase